MRDDGRFTEEEQATIFGAGGASAVPSYLASGYGRTAFKPYPTTAYAWLLGAAGFAIFLAAIVGLALAIRAARGGTGLGWLAAAWCVVAGVSGALLWTWLMDSPPPSF